VILANLEGQNLKDFLTASDPTMVDPPTTLWYGPSTFKCASTALAL